MDNVIDDYIKLNNLRQLHKLTSHSLRKYYCACGKHCLYYKQYNQMLNLLEIMPIRPAVLSSKALERKKLKNNFYLYHVLIQDVDIGGRTCIFCGLNMHMECGYRVLDIVQPNHWTCVPCYKSNYSTKVATSEISKSVSYFI